VRLNNERHIFVRGSSITLEFVDVVEKLLEEQKEAESTVRESKRRASTKLSDVRQDEEKEREKEREERAKERGKEDLRRTAETFVTNFLFDFASAMGRSDQRDFLNKIVTEKSVDYTYLSSIYPAYTPPSPPSATQQQQPTPTTAGAAQQLPASSSSLSSSPARNFAPSMFSDLLLFGLPTMMAYTGWGSIKFDYSTLSFGFAPSPSLYVLFTMENSMEASGACIGTFTLWGEGRRATKELIPVLCCSWRHFVQCTSRRQAATRICRRKQRRWKRRRSPKRDGTHALRRA
jgi:predicted RNA-binding protein with RPS1 domain